MKRRAGAAFLALLLAACGRTGDGVRPREDGPLSVVLISIDTLRADRVGCYGFSGIRTPAIPGGGSRFALHQ